MKIVWAITGAGHLLEESVKLAEELAKTNEVTILLSGAGEDVCKMYGLYNKLEKITGGRYRELALEEEQKYGYPITGRLSLSKYDLLIVSPATANTVAKIVHGISDTLVTNAVAQAGKGQVDTLIVPVDYELEDVETILPAKIELKKCKNCEICDAEISCPEDAIIKNKEINLQKCIGCGACEDACEYNAIVSGKIITIHMRPIDVENTQKLTQIDNIKIFKEPSELLCYIRKTY